MSSKTDQDRAIALAAVYQASQCVRDIARIGHTDPTALKTCIDSLFKFDAESTVAVYDGLSNLKTGLRLLAKQLRNPQDAELTRYVLLLLTLERKLRRKPAMLQTIRTAIELSLQKLQHFPSTHENTLASLGDAYAETVSTLRPRIMVNGEHIHLTQPENANCIRALLLAGIRAAILWRQNGGSWFKLVLRRKPLALETQQLLTSLDTTNGA